MFGRAELVSILVDAAWAEVAVLAELADAADGNALSEVSSATPPGEYPELIRGFVQVSLLISAIFRTR
jgi:hypothetical protein